MSAHQQCASPLPRAGPTVTEVLRTYAPDWLASQAGVDFHTRDVLARLCACRTAALGGHLQRCGHCGAETPIYNGCLDRHCPRCQALERRAWVESRLAKTLPCPHVHMVFTVPAALRPLAPRQPRLLYDAMFYAVRRTLTDLGRERLDARLAITAVLHTWNQELGLHPHIHCLVTAGGLSLDDEHWVAAPRARWLFPQAQLRARFQYHLLGRLDRLVRKGALSTEDLDALGVDPDPQHGWKRWLRQRHAEKWIVYAKVPLAGAEQVLRYLGQYTHRVAISDHRLLAHDAEAGTVTIKTRRGPRTMTGRDFVQRFARHVLPKGFCKIRHFGLLAPANVPRRLPIAGRLLGVEDKADREFDLDAILAELAADTPPGQLYPVSAEPACSTEPAWVARASALVGRDLTLCPHCQHRAITWTALPAARGPP